MRESPFKDETSRLREILSLNARPIIAQFWLVPSSRDFHAHRLVPVAVKAVFVKHREGILPQTWHIPVPVTFASVECMNLQDIWNQIDVEIAQLKQVKAILAGIGMSGDGGKKSIGKHTMSPEGRARIIAAQRKRWAAVHKAARLANRKKLPGKTKPPTLTTKA